MPTAAVNGSNVAPVTVKLSDEDKIALRALIREEVAQTAGAAKENANPATADAGAAPPPSPAAAEAYKAARATIDKQITAGSWSDANSTQLREVLPSLSADARLEVVRPLIIAINEGRVHFEDHGPIF